MLVVCVFLAVSSFYASAAAPSSLNVSESRVGAAVVGHRQSAGRRRQFRLLRRNRRYDDVTNLNVCQNIRFGRKCYHLALNDESWHDAKDYCEEIGMRLTSIDSMEEADFLASALSTSGYRYFWIGANDKETEGLWVNLDNTVAFTGYWARDEPNGDWREDCGELMLVGGQSGRLNDKTCHEDRRFICSRETDETCVKGGYIDRCYLFSLHQTTFYEAKKHCRGLGMRLARARDNGVSGFMATQMKGSSWVDSLVGVSVDSPDFILSSYSQSTPTCLELRKVNLSGRVGRIPCQSRRYFVCESTPSASGQQSYAESVINGDTDHHPMPPHVSGYGGGHHLQQPPHAYPMPHAMPPPRSPPRPAHHHPYRPAAAFAPSLSHHPVRPPFHNRW